MPRTKRPTKRTSKKAEETTIADKENHSGKFAAVIKEFDVKSKAHVQNVKLSHLTLKQKLQVLASQYRLYIPANIGNKTIEEIRNGNQNSTLFCTFSDTTSSSSVLEVTRTVKRNGVNRKRSLSVADDDGYLTAGSDNNSGRGRRTSRLTSKQVKTTRVSRSASRSKNQQSSMYTPAMSRPPLVFGTVTPKMKPNTPQVILRRPKEGEMAISMQGSPLMVNTILSSEANVNIPLNDGRTISIQPQRGLRMSQLPPLDPIIRRQIEALRDNLIKVCLNK